MGKGMKEFSISKVLYYGVITIEIVIASIVTLLFPVDLVLDLGWKKYSAEDIEKNYREYAGLPAGEGINQITDVEEFHQSYLKYATFETDSIIPLDVYRLKSLKDKRRTAKSGRRIVYRGNRETYVKKFPAERVLYNRYYLVRLPDKNYIIAYLDDAYYLKYLLRGKVQLPIGQMEYIPSNEKTYFASCVEEYGLEAEEVMVMFSEERYEKCEIVNFLILIAVWIVVMVILCLMNELVASMWKKIWGK